MRPLPLAFAALPAPLEVILLVCINSPMYLEVVSDARYAEDCSAGNSRLEKAIAAFELLVLVLDYLDAIDDFHEASLQLLGLSGSGC